MYTTHLAHDKSDLAIAAQLLSAEAIGAETTNFQLQSITYEDVPILKESKAAGKISRGRPTLCFQTLFAWTS